MVYYNGCTVASSHMRRLTTRISGWILESSPKQFYNPPEPAAYLFKPTHAPFKATIPVTPKLLTKNRARNAVVESAKDIEEKIQME